MKKTVDIMSKAWKWLLVFGFVFSEISFPLGVLADELDLSDDSNQEIVENLNDTDNLVPVDDVLTDEPVVTINGEKTLEYTISGDNTEVVVSLEYQDLNETVTLDFSKKLYGIYEYTFDSVDVVVTINYNGNNALLLKNYETVLDLTKKLSCDTNMCIISGFGVDLVTVGDITNGYYNLEAFGDEYNAGVVITNGEEVLLETDTVLNDYKLEIIDNQSEEVLEGGVLVNTTPKSSYLISRVGDVFIPSDGLIDVKDQEAIVDDILQENELTNMNDVNEDEELNILDATHSTFMEPTIVDGEVTDLLVNSLTIDKEEVFVGDTLEVKLFVSGFEQLSLYGIEGLLSYDDSILELVGAKVYSSSEEEDYLGYLNLDNKKFAYVLSNGFNDSEVALLTLEFKALSVGSSDVTISNILESYGEAFEISNDTVTVSVEVLEDGFGGDVDEDDTTVEEDKKEEEKEEVVETKPVVRPIVLSSDYYIKNLSIVGHDIDFDMYTYEYSIKVGHDVNSLDFSVLLNSNKSIYYVEGNENFEVGENLVYLVVKAENGSTKTYTIRVDKEKEAVVTEEQTEIDEDDVEEETKSTSKTVIIILIVLVIIGLIYVIFKDDEEDKKAIAKDSHSEKVKSEKVKTEKVKVEQEKSKNVNKSPKKGNKRK